MTKVWQGEEKRREKNNEKWDQEKEKIRWKERRGLGGGKKRGMFSRESADINIDGARGAGGREEREFFPPERGNFLRQEKEGRKQLTCSSREPRGGFVGIM